MFVRNLRQTTLRAGFALIVASSSLLLLSTSLLAEMPANPDDLPPIVHIDKPLRGIVLARDGEVLRRIEGAHIGTGEISILTDAAGLFHIPAGIRTNRLSVVAPGYEVVRRVTTADYAVVFMHPLAVRAIYLAYDHLRTQSVLDWVIELARSGAITALVVDVKDEAGSVLPLAATDQVRTMGAVRDTGTDVEGFLEELGNLGLYRIARIVTFLDGRYAFSFPTEAHRSYDGAIFRDSGNGAWSNAFSEGARRHNIDIGVRAARWFEEIQYDYVRFPTDPGVVARNNANPQARSNAIASFARDASLAIHAVGGAISIDTFGQTTVIPGDGGIGQILEDLAPFLDYYSPMIYPSTWATGWFGLDYPPADPFTVVKSSIEIAVARLEPFGNIQVRPWLQDFPDYQSQKLSYGADRVRAQIDASHQAGGIGFMLWDRQLSYQIDLLNSLDDSLYLSTTSVAAAHHLLNFGYSRALGQMLMP